MTNKELRKHLDAIQMYCAAQNDCSVCVLHSNRHGYKCKLNTSLPVNWEVVETLVPLTTEEKLEAAEKELAFYKGEIKKYKMCVYCKHYNEENDSCPLKTFQECVSQIEWELGEVPDND